MDIAVFGGAFDPPHLGHLTIARQLLKQHLANEVWFLPVKNHPFSKNLSAEEHRLAMLELMIEAQMRIETYELEQETVSYTYKSLKALVKQHSQHRFSFVIGSDNLQKFPEWDHATELAEQFQIFVYPRKTYPLSPLLINMQIIENVPEIEVSSTQIKELVKQGSDIKELVTPDILRYIQQNKLYSNT